jgi:hypothetical protein
MVRVSLPKKLIAMFRTILTVTFLLFPILSVSATTTLLLKDGGTLEGELLNPDEINRRSYRIKTPEGLEITLDAKLVERIQARERDALIEYNRDAPLTRHTVENHFHWAKWCNEHQLPDQAKVHWQQILEIDTDHAEARKVLGYSKTQTGWVSYRDTLEKQGLIRDRQGRWKTPQQIEVENILGNQSEAAQHWQRTVRELYRRLPNPQAEAELLAIRDPAAFLPIRKILIDETNPQRRTMLLRLLAQFSDVPSLQFVAGWAIRPDEPYDDIRKMCVEELQKRIKEQPEIRLTVMSVYRHSLNPRTDPAVIHLAAQVVGDIGGYEAVPELIEVLVVMKTETYLPQTPTYGFGSGGSGFGLPGSPKTRQIPITNQPVLSALQKLTGVNFEFNQGAWREWYRQAQRSPSLNLRRD